MTISKRIFDVTLNIKQPINFCTDKLRHIMIELNNIYLYKCYLGSYILEINEILQSSSCILLPTDSTGIINVKFLATVYILSCSDILIGTELKEIKQLFIGEYNKSNMSIQVIFKSINIPSNTLTVGKLVPVRVIKAIHKPMSDTIVAAACLLTCDQTLKIYKIKGEISKSQLPEIQLILNDIKEELSLRSKINSSSVRFFESLLFTYKDMPRQNEKIKIGELYWEGPVYADKNKTVNIFDMTSNNLTGYWYKPLNMCKSSPMIVFSDSKPPGNVKPIKYNKPNTMVLELARNIYTYLKAIREFTEIYNTKELIDDHKTVWDTMRSVQLE